MSDTYRLQSSSLCYAPGTINYFIALYRDGRDKDKLCAIEGMSAWDNLPGSVILDLLREKIEFKVEGDVVIIDKAA